MNWPKKRTFTPMHRAIWISSIVLACSAVASAQPGISPLARAVQPPLADAPLSGMLALLSRQSGIPISYSSSRIGGQRRCRVRPGPPRPLGTVLHEVAGQFRLSYGMLNGQLVLWPAAEPAPPGVAELNSLGQNSRRQPPASPASNPSATADAFAGELGKGPPANGPGRPPGLAGGAANARRLPSGFNPVAPAPPTRPAGPRGSDRASSRAPLGIPPRGGVAVRAAHPLEKLKIKTFGPRIYKTAGGLAITTPRATSRISAAVSPLPRRGSVAKLLAVADSAMLPRVVVVAAAANALGETPALLAPGPAPEALARPQTIVRRQWAQVSLLPPLSSNWLANARTVNTYSLNVLAGYSAGVNQLELGGLLNVVRDSVHGLQAAGLANVTGTDVRGVQLAGLANVNGGAVRGVQGAGLVNIARDDARGLQIAGLANITGGAGHAGQRPDQPTRLRRWLGLPRLLATNSLGQLPVAPSSSQPGFLVQAAAVTNLTGTDVHGLQTSALFNLAHRVRGAQIGLVNVARHVGGVQFGLVNFADSVDGASIGIINIVRHGYLHGEVWASETLPLNAVVKLGVRRYYTILGAAAEPFGSRVQWAAGFGIGTAGLPHGRFTFSLDALQWTLAGTTDNTSSETIDARLLTQLRPAVAWQIEREGHLQLVISPTLNLAIAWSNDHQPQWDFGANQLLLINTAGAQSRTRLWPGLQVGLRF